MKKFKADFAFLIFVTIIISILKLVNTHPTFSDENVYFLMGKRVAEGLIPYKEFNFVHPPLQIYMLALFFKIFGVSLNSGKLLSLISSSISVLFLYFISKKIHVKNPILTVLFFILAPAFLIFSDQGNGMWECLAFLLISIYFLLEEQIYLSIIFFSISVFTRYLSLLFFPFLLFLLFLRKGNLVKFLFFSIFSLIIIFITFLLIFGYNFIDQTILFQFNARFNYTRLPKLFYNYLNFGFFNIFLCLTSIFIAYEKKDKFSLLFSAYPLTYDLLLFISFKTLIYHYFILSLPLTMIAASKTFFSKYTSVKIFIILVIFLAIYKNLPTFNFYINRDNSKIIIEIKEYVQTKASKNDNIFGESSVVDYIAFSTNISITSNYLDSYLDYLRYVSEEKVIENLEREKPKFIIDLEGYLISNQYFKNYLEEKYILDKIFPGTPTYLIYVRK